MFFKEKKQVKVVKEDDGGEEDVINCGNPVDLIISLLKKLGGAASVNQLCQVKTYIHICFQVDKLY